MVSKKISGIQTGISGEYFVAAELSRRGYPCSITIKNTKGIDILVSSKNSKRLIGIQVKSNQGNKKDWVLNEKAEEFAEDNLFYVFTSNLDKLNVIPDYYIVPSGIVASYIRKDHREWLLKKGVKGQPHKDNPLRKFRDAKQKYKNR